MACLVFGTFSAKANDNIICAIEEIAQEEQVEFEEVIDFLQKVDIQPEAIEQPELYVKTFSWLNTPYRYGGNSRSGIDCSRFTYQLKGSSWCVDSRGSSADLFQLGNPIEKDELKEGDLVFFKTRQGRISHVGVYLQNGKFAHSSSSQGVIVSDLSENYWRNTFYKGARFP